MSVINAIRDAHGRIERGENTLPEDEKEFQKLFEEYYDRFGDTYNVCIHSPESRMPTSWHIERMREALRTGIPIEDPEPEIPPGILI